VSAKLCFARVAGSSCFTQSKALVTPGRHAVPRDVQQNFIKTITAYMPNEPNQLNKFRKAKAILRIGLKSNKLFISV